MKTGECYYLDEDGNLCLATSYCDENGHVTTSSALVEQG
jgi:hypothetical protein